MQETQFSALAAVRALRGQLVTRLEANEDFRVLKALESALSQASRLPPSVGVQTQPAAAARPLQDEVAADRPTPPSSVCVDEQPLVFANVG